MCDSSLKRAFLVAVGLIAVTAAAVADVQQAGGYYYTYFDEQIPLGLDPGRVAVWMDGPTTDATLAAFGLAADDLRPYTNDGWQFAELSEPVRDATPVPVLVPALANAQAADFVSPVLLDKRGDPVIITPVLLIGFEPDLPTTQAETVLSGYVDGEVLERDWADMDNVYRVQCRSRDGFEVLALANLLAELPEVLYAEPDMIMTVHKTLIPNDPYFSSLWGIRNTSNDMDMDGDEAWDKTTGSSSIVIAVLDDGVQQNHPDINQYSGADFTGEGSGGGPGNQCDNHGTACAGCVSAIINNNTGVVGIAPECRIRSAKWSVSNVPCDGAGYYYTSWLVSALNWAQNIGARVTTNSNGLNPASSVTNKYNSTRNAGLVHFAATGNEGSSSITYPASLSSVNGIGAVNSNGNRASFSNYGTGIAFVAPGVNIRTTDRTGSSGYEYGDYAWVDGTSFSSPYAAGVAALVLSMDNSLTPALVEQALYNTCMDRGSSGYDTVYGYGIVNARAAVDYVDNTQYYTLTINTSGQGSVTLDPSGGIYASGTSVQLTAEPTYGWVFDHWEGSLSGSSNPASITMNSNKTVTAVFVEEVYTLTAMTQGSGTITLDPPGGAYPVGTVVQLMARQDIGWHFDHWSGHLDGSGNPEYLTMDGDKTVVAVFEETSYFISITIEGQGSVTLDPPGGTYAFGTVVELTAEGESGWVFDHWAGALSGAENPKSITVNGNKLITAVFVEEQQQYTLTVNVTGNGDVTLNPPGGTYDSGTTVQLTADADADWSFDHWEGALSGATNPTTIYMDSDKTVTAVFEPTNDCNGNGVPDEDDLSAGTSYDCNGNGIPDECDIGGISLDCNTNGVPDECELGSVSGLAAAYYDGVSLSGTVHGRVDATVDFNWASGEAWSGLGVDTFSVRWTGWVHTPAAAGTYTFYTTTDDGVRLWVGGQLLIDQWIDQSATEWSGTISLEADEDYRLVMEYYENGGSAVAELRWEPPGMSKVIIPSSNLAAGRDCNENGVPDACDIAGGTSTDTNGNGVPDECEASILVGDINGDGLVDNFDISPFVYAVTHSEVEFVTQYPAGQYGAADINQDGQVDNFDISPFVSLLTGG
ncbi:MAG: S8 family serine peptidase [Phycisphaerae bacterium]|jgi:subtilisin family serine protease